MSLVKAKDILLECYEGETPRITGTLYDQEDQLVPDDLIQSVTVMVYDLNSGITLRAATTVTTSDSKWETWLTETETAILDQTLDYELKIVTILSSYLSGTDVRHANAEAKVKVNNLTIYHP